MTDLEIVKRCAEKMGIEVDLYEQGVRALGLHQEWHIGIGGVVYDPLHDDAQAMALVKKFNLGISPMASIKLGWECSWWDGDNPKSELRSVNVDLNRAICECVAELP